MAITFDIDAGYANGWPLVVLFDVRAWYDHPEAVAARAAQILTPEEYSDRRGTASVRVRTQRFTSRIVLREACGLLCGIAPEDVRFAFNEHGKPRLDHPLGVTPVVEGACHFNLSHTEALIAFGASTAGPLGIDIERVAARPGLAPIARRFFHDKEYAYATAMGQPLAEQRFFEVWTRKEALLKAMGTGLATDLRRVAVPLPGEEQWYSGAAGTFEVMDVPMPEGIAGAIAFTAPAAHDRGAIALQRVTPMLSGAH